MIPPDALQTYCPEDASLIARDLTVPERLTVVDDLSRAEFSRYLLAGIAFWECLYRKDLDESILSTKLVWEFNRRGRSTFMYEGSGIQTGDQFKPYKNSLFRKGGFAVLTRRATENGRPDSVPIYVKIHNTLFTEAKTQIIFKIDAMYLLQRWNLRSQHELVDANYKIEPTDLLAHLRAFNSKLNDPNYILSRVNTHTPRGRILDEILPPPKMSQTLGFRPPSRGSDFGKVFGDC